MKKQNFNFVFVFLILLSFVGSFFISDLNTNTESSDINTEPDFVSKKIIAIMKVFDYYKSDLSQTHKFLIACAILKMEKKYNLDGLSFLGVLKVESDMKHRDKKGKIITSYKGAKNISQVMPGTMRGMISRCGFRDRIPVTKALKDPVLATYFGGRYYADLKKEYKKPLYYNTSYNEGPINKSKVKERYVKGGCKYHKKVISAKTVVTNIVQQTYNSFDNKKEN